jgi:hypothetical protein
MTTFAALPDAERELETRIAAAWTTYGEELRGLNPDAYADVEPGAWARLQATLCTVREQRTERATTP